MQISFDGLFANMLIKFFFQNFCNPFPLQKAKNYRNLATENGSKQRFCLLQQKVVIQAEGLRTPTIF